MCVYVYFDPTLGKNVGVNECTPYLPLALALPCDPAKELAEQLAELAWWLSLRLNAWVLSVSTRKQEAFLV